MKAYTYTVADLEEMVNHAVNVVKQKMVQDGLLTPEQAEPYAVLIRDQHSVIEFVKKFIGRFTSSEDKKDSIYFIPVKLS